MPGILTCNLDGDRNDNTQHYAKLRGKRVPLNPEKKWKKGEEPVTCLHIFFIFVVIHVYNVNRHVFPQFFSSPSPPLSP